MKKRPPFDTSSPVRQLPALPALGQSALVRRPALGKPRLPGLPAHPSGSVQTPPLPDSGAAATTYILLDCSGSMCGEPLLQAKEGAIEAARSLARRGHSVGLISFGSAEHHVPPARTLADLDGTIRALSAGGGTPLTPAIERATDSLRSADVRSIVIASDGHPNRPADALRAATAAKSRGISIICISIDGAADEFLEKLASPERALRTKTQDISQTFRRATTLALLPAGAHVPALPPKRR